VSDMPHEPQDPQNNDELPWWDRPNEYAGFVGIIMWVLVLVLAVVISTELHRH
jgi:hypothetical protein